MSRNQLPSGNDELRNSEKVISKNFYSPDRINFLN